MRGVTALSLMTISSRGVAAGILAMALVLTLLLFRTNALTAPGSALSISGDALVKTHLVALRIEKL